MASPVEQTPSRPRRLWLHVAGIVVVAVISLQGADQELYLSKTPHVPLGTMPLKFGTHESIDFELELRTLSIEDRDRFPVLVIDDYRYDEPNYFVDGRVPNVRFEVLEVSRDGALAPVSYRVLSQGFGVDVEYRTAHVRFQFGRSHPMYWLIDHLWIAGGLFAQHWAGTYRIRAMYREFVTPPVLVTVQ